MTINISMPRGEHELKPRITVIGCGGAGGNAVNNMIRAQLQGVDFVVANTDAQALQLSLAERRVQLGVGITQGLGAGARPDVGRASAEETLHEILEHLAGSHMAFIAAGMGGGTGTGAAPVIARAAREQGILTVGVVTKPFHFEGAHRMKIAEQGIEELQRHVDTLIIIPNQNLFRVANERTTFADAFKMADDVLYSGVRGVTDLMVMPGLINLDFADIRTVMSEMGKAMMGTGEAEGDNRAIDAAQKAISNPLLDDVSMKGARGVLINITGGPDMTLFEVDEAANRIRDEVDPEANIIFGSTFDETLAGKVRISVVATGIDAQAMVEPKPTVISLAQSRQAASQRPQQQAARAEGSAALKIDANQAIPMTAEPVVARQPQSVTMHAPAQAYAQAPAPQPAAPVVQPQPQPAVARTAPAAPQPQYRPAPAPQSYMSVAPAPQPVQQAAPPQQPAQATSFIAPRPIEAAREPAMVRADLRPQAEAYAAPAAEPAPRAAQPEEKRDERRRGPSLFERVTGTGRAREQRPAPAQAAPLVAPRPEQPAASAPMPAPAPAPAPAPQQTRLGGLDPTDRIPTSRPEDDLLDIPAFLRRQAN
ncbi:MAG: cell division protein FtsZ [Alphaproteobacteria bacterium]|nr:cell division protein FtsZ [Alphaproteobacteria bacterium]